MAKSGTSVETDRVKNARLPSAASDDTAARQAADSDVPATTPADIRVLIVDNDAAHAETVAESLNRVGYECFVATSGTEGARLVEREHFDIIITDLMMSDVNGIEILKRARQLLPECEVILVTGHGTIPSAVEAMQQGAFKSMRNS